jgi:rhamnosyltransferase
VDSGSTDSTLAIAADYGCRIVQIPKDLFSFGRSLNYGCEAAKGDILVFISGHCVPTDTQWLVNLSAPIQRGEADYVYGRQVGGPNCRFSEARILYKYYPDSTLIPKDDYYCNNANAALSREIWKRHPFDEQLTGLEDMDAAKRILENRGRIGYVAEAVVIHHHDESWRQVRCRFEREAIALKKIAPQIALKRRDLVRYIFAGIWKDCVAAYHERALLKHLKEIMLYRVNQYVGSYLGNHKHKELTLQEKHKYFYPE